MRVIESQISKRTLRPAYPLYSLVTDWVFYDEKFIEVPEVSTQHHPDSLCVEVVAVEMNIGQELPLQVVEEDIGCLG